MTVQIPVEDMSIDLDIQRATTSSAIPDDEQFRLWAELLLSREGMEQSGHDHTLAIRIVDEQEGRRLNRQYRGKDYASNVLSFPVELPEDLPSAIRQNPLGDLLICAPVVAREAIEQGKPEINHWAHMTIHGVLHLLGYDHAQDTDAAVMEAVEIDMLARLDIPDPYQIHI